DRAAARRGVPAPFRGGGDRRAACTDHRDDGRRVDGVGARVDVGRGAGDRGAARDRARIRRRASRAHGACAARRPARTGGPGGGLVSVPTTLLGANRTRRRVRRILLVVSAPFLLLALALCGKLLSMYAFAHQSAAAYAAGDVAGTTQAARGQLVLSWFEPYKAPFNVGVGLADAGELRGARAAFEESLGLAHGLEQCVVRVNLAIVLERTGDAAMRAGDPTAA